MRATAKKTAMGRLAVAAYLAEHEDIIRAAFEHVDHDLERNLRVSLGDVAFKVRSTCKAARPLMEWRIRSIVSTACAMGAFRGSGVELRRGIGFTRRRALRVVQGGRR